MASLALTEKQAKAVYDVLVRVCGHERDDWGSFLHYIREDRGGKEYRFCGSLGFGGKIYIESNRWRVGYYPEHRTDEREAAVEQANRELARLREEMR